jgi:hypothetical protein
MRAARSIVVVPTIQQRSFREKVHLKHIELNHTIFNLAACESLTSDALERVPMFVEVAEGLVLRPKRRPQAAHLPNRADRQNEIYGLPLVSPGLGHDPDIGHGASSR